MSLPEPDPALVELIKERRAGVEAQISAAGRSLDEVTVVAVTKGFGADVVAAGFGAGFRIFGENYADELVEKAVAAGDTPLSWTFQGRMQSNKINRLAPHVGLWQTVSSVDQAASLAKRVPSARVLVQVNLTGRDVQGGCSFAELDRTVDGVREAGLRLEGLMGIGPDIDDASSRRAAFASLAKANERWSFPVLSMGMSNDFVDAVAAGSTMIRLGSVLFGSRTVTFDGNVSREPRTADGAN